MLAKLEYIKAHPPVIRKRNKWDDVMDDAKEDLDVLPKKEQKLNFNQRRGEMGKNRSLFLTKISILSAPCGWEQNFKMGFLIKKEAICPRAY